MFCFLVKHLSLVLTVLKTNKGLLFMCCHHIHVCEIVNTAAYPLDPVVVVVVVDPAAVAVDVVVVVLVAAVVDLKKNLHSKLFFSLI